MEESQNKEYKESWRDEYLKWSFYRSSQSTKPDGALAGEIEHRIIEILQEEPDISQEALGKT